MTETRAIVRDLAVAAYVNATVERFSHRGIYAVADAVYAEALRDVLAMFATENEASDMCNHRGGARDAIRAFAAERGIELEIEAGDE